MIAREQELEEMQATRLDDQELTVEVASLAKMLQKTQETLRLVPEENTYLKETVDKSN